MPPQVLLWLTVSKAGDEKLVQDVGPEHRLSPLSTEYVNKTTHNFFFYRLLTRLLIQLRMSQSPETPAQRPLNNPHIAPI